MEAGPNSTDDGLKYDLAPQQEVRLHSIFPGIDVGHQFFSRCEMVAVGFHSHWLSGIDYIGQSAHKMFKRYTLPLTIAIVLSGQYENDLDNGEDVIYTGQGGNDLLGNKSQIQDQVMLRGNLGLKHLCGTAEDFANNLNVGIISSPGNLDEKMKANNEDTSRATLLMKTRSKKDGTIPDNDTRSLVEMMTEKINEVPEEEQTQAYKEQVFVDAYVMGPDGHDVPSI